MGRRVVGGVERFATDGRGIKDHLGSVEGKATRDLGEPLIPADADAHAAHRGGERDVTGVAGAEVVLLAVAGSVRDVALAVHAENFTVDIDDGTRVEEVVAVAFVETDREHDPQFTGQPAEVLDRRMTGQGSGPFEMLGALVLAEVSVVEQLGQQDESGTARMGFANQSFGGGDIGTDIAVGHRHLHRGDGEGAPGRIHGRLFRQTTTPVRRAANSSVWAGSLARCNARPPMTSAPRRATAFSMVSSVRPGLSAKVQKVAARLPTSDGRALMDPMPHGD